MLPIAYQYLELIPLGGTVARHVSRQQIQFNFTLVSCTGGGGGGAIVADCW